VVIRPELRAWLRFAAGVAFVVVVVVALFVAGYVREEPFLYTCAGLVAIIANLPLSISVQTYFDRLWELREQERAREDREIRLKRAREDVVRS
jgi:hypothetical protein